MEKPFPPPTETTSSQACWGSINPVMAINEAWLSDHVLGIKIVDVERKQISIEPHLGKLEWAKGTYPTPWGVIEVSHEKKADGKIATKVKLPKGVRQI